MTKLALVATKELLAQEEGRHIRSNSSPSDETPVLLDTTTQGNLLADICACRAGEDQLRGILLDGRDLGAGGRRADVDHDDFVLGQLLDLGLLSIGGSHTEQPAQQV